MKAIIHSKVRNKGEQTFYVKVNGRDYFLFTQDYRKSNKDVFAKGVVVDDLRKLSSHCSTSVRATVEKLPSYLHYIESEYGVAIYDKTERKQKVQKVKTPYKRTPFIWQQYNWEAV